MGLVSPPHLQMVVCKVEVGETGQPGQGVRRQGDDGVVGQVEGGEGEQGHGDHHMYLAARSLGVSSHRHRSAFSTSASFSSAEIEHVE